MLSKLRFTAILSFLLIATTAFLFQACQKDKLLTPTTLAPSRELSVKDVKQWYKGSAPKKGQIRERSEFTKTPMDVVPICPTAFATITGLKDSIYQGAVESVITPVIKDSRLPMDRTHGSFMIFHRGANGEIRSNLVVFLADSSAYKDPTKVVNSKTFTGDALIIANDLFNRSTELGKFYKTTSFKEALYLTNIC